VFVDVERRSADACTTKVAVVEITVAYYIGIDGGGSKTTCVVGDEVSVLATAVAGPSNITRVGEVRAARIAARGDSAGVRCGENRSADKFIEAAWAWLAWDTEKLPAQ